MNLIVPLGNRYLCFRDGVCCSILSTFFYFDFIHRNFLYLVACCWCWCCLYFIPVQCVHCAPPYILVIAFILLLFWHLCQCSRSNGDSNISCVCCQFLFSTRITIPWIQNNGLDISFSFLMTKIQMGFLLIYSHSCWYTYKNWNTVTTGEKE